MARQKTTNPNFLNGVPELLVLQLLSRRAMHGYEVVRSIRESTGERLAIGEGCIYPLLHRLESEGSLVARRERIQNRDRIIYAVSPLGRRRLAESTDNWRRVVEAVTQALEGPGHAEPGVV
jgi:PadR family transcriptional regulator PadR